ncbi:urease accessory protein UreF [Alicyclobacillus fodiniaquatilis]|uniref:Urease accessory protein UreF n=1 Tax=Alicyclobacillus fodiniaquatilis TaxID=1661150 RepID=A0ABW4JI19_9BACL
MNPAQFSFMLQMGDGNFPNGAFSHSFGLETLIEAGLVVDAATFEQALADWFHLQLVPFDGLAAHIAWALTKAGDMEGLLALAELVSASLLAEQSKRGALLIGKRSLQVLHDLVPHGGATQWYWEKVAAGEACATHALALAVASAEMGIGQDFTRTAVLYSALSSLIAAAVRAVPIGQSAGQQLLATGRSWIESAPSMAGYQMADISSTAAMWEIAQMNHKALNGRLFMS